MRIKLFLYTLVCLRRKVFVALSVILLFCVIQSCSIKKYIPEDEYLYEGATINVISDTLIENQDAIQSDLESIVRPTPNKKILGSYLGLYYHYKAQREKPGFINKFLNKKLGEDPVYASDVEPEEMEEIFLNRLENRGYFYSNVNSQLTENDTTQTATATYGIKLLKPYTLASYQLDNDSLMVYRAIENNLSESVMKTGMRFNLNAMKAERLRIDNALKKKGYYNFNSGFLIFNADSSQYKERKFDLFLKLKKNVPVKSIIPYRIERVNVYPNYNVDNDTIKRDSARYDNKNYLQQELFFKPKRLNPFVLINEGQYYDPEISRNTSRRLGSIGIYKFINIQYKELDTEADDSLGQLEANIYLSPLNKRSLRLELQGVSKSNGFAGPTLNTTYSDRNLFNGGETFNLSAKVGYEVQAGGGGGKNAGQSSLTLGLGSELIFPRLLFPIEVNDKWFKYNIPKTKVGLSGDYLKRSNLFSLLSGTATFGYVWQANRFVTHELNPISLNYVKLANTTPKFDTILQQNPYLKTSFDQQFISGLTYSFTYNGMIDTNAKNQFYLNVNFDTAGNSLDLFTGSSASGEPKTVLGLEFAEYAKLDGDLRYHYNFGKNLTQTIAARLFAGLGLAYGNSEVLPYTKQYFSGGPYSVRAFGIRSLGPGTYSTEEDDPLSYYDQTGNLRLEGNVEYRFPIVSVVKGALFADAGNVWNTNNDESILPGGQFSSNWYNELGIGAGVGLRVDIQSFVIRFDLAAPIHDPGKPEGDRWEFNVSKPVFNFAIGYPF